MTSTITRFLSHTTAATFEDLAFLVPDVELSEEQASAVLETEASVEFRGPLNGRLLLRASASVLSLLAENMTGDADGRSEALQHDALGELANVIAGNVLPIVAGAKAEFFLGSPRVVRLTDSNADDRAAKARVTFGVEDGHIEALLFVRRASTQLRASRRASSAA